MPLSTKDTNKGTKGSNKGTKEGGSKDDSNLLYNLITIITVIQLPLLPAWGTN